MSVIISWFSQRYDANLDEIEGPLSQFNSLSEFFTRRLKKGLRPLSEGDIVSPCDGLITVSSQLYFHGSEIKIKGVKYNVEKLVGRGESDLCVTRENTKMMVVSLYLAPGNYHRFHSPCVWTVEQTTFSWKVAQCGS